MKEKILIADDSPINQQILTEVLGDGYEYLYCDDGVKALELLETHLDIDLLLLDINMPKLDGFGVLEAMQSRQWAEEVPVIVISAEDDSSFIQRAYALGTTDYIRRPFNLTIVQRRVSNTLKLYARQNNLVRMVKKQVLEREKANNTMVNILSAAIESRNNETGDHLLHVRILTELLLRQLVHLTDQYKLSESEISMIITLSALHDMGKIRVPWHILNKPGKLDDEEWEIMKKHTVYGDDFLQNSSLDLDDPMVRTAHEICRWHHERWDGKGYPDGLVGDEIPISAQVVALADVYDALTANRCYKRAYSHDTAIAMIMAGKCGAFNPLLLECLRSVSNLMRQAISEYDKLFDYRAEAMRLSMETLEQQALPLDDRAQRLIGIEREKTQFLSKHCGGTQFSYNSWTDKLSFTSWNEQGQAITKVLQLDVDNGIDLLRKEDWKRLQNLYISSTRSNPDFQAEVLAPVSGVWRWYRVEAHTLWASDNIGRCGAVGIFTDIHEEVLGRSMGVPQLAGSDAGKDLLETCTRLRKMVDLVRIVDPLKNHVLTFDQDGNITETPECCYAIWNKSVCCGNCSSRRAMEETGWVSKLESKDGDLYCVLSRYTPVDGRACVLEVAVRLDSNSFASCEVGISGSANPILPNFYQDSMTHAYSRLYLDSFGPSLEGCDAVGFLDLDHFKQINDTYGHHIGDLAIEALGSTILSRIRGDDKLIRYGGDEFVLIFPKIKEEVFNRRLKEIRTAVRSIVIDECPQLRLDVSYGGAYRTAPLSEAIREADLQMYHMKNKKRANNKD